MDVGCEQALFHSYTASKGGDIDLWVREKDSGDTDRLRIGVGKAFKRDIFVEMIPVDAIGIERIIFALPFRGESQLQYTVGIVKIGYNFITTKLISRAGKNNTLNGYKRFYASINGYDENNSCKTKILVISLSP